VVLRTPSFQTFAGRLAASYLSEKLQTTVLLDKIRISNWLRIEMMNLSVDDLSGTKLLSAASLELGAEKINIRERTLKLGYISMKQGSFSLITYAGDSTLNLNRLLEPLTGEQPPVIDEDLAPWTFACKRLQLNDIEFVLRNENRMKPSEGMDYNDMVMTGINLDAVDILMIGDSIKANILFLAAMEKSGLNLKSFKGNASFSPRHIEVSGLNIDLNESLLDMDVLFTYEDLGAFMDFIHKVKMHSVMRDCNLNLRDIGYFAPVMFAMDDKLRFSGEMDGKVSDFLVKDFKFELGDYTRFAGDVSMKGLPDIYSTEAILDIEEFMAFAGDIGNFSIPGGLRYIPVPQKIEELGIISMKGTYQGIYNDFNLDMEIQTDLGNLWVDAQASLLPGTRIPVYAGDIRGEKLTLGTLFQYPDLGSFDFDAEIQGTGVNASDLNAFANIWLEGLEFRGQQYDRIIVGGDFTVNTFSGRCLVFDESLSLSFDGLVDFSKELPLFRFNAELERARFSEMNLSDRGPDMDLRGRFDADFEGIDADSFRGSIILDSLMYTENGSTYELRHLELLRQRDTMLRDFVTLNSDYLDAHVEGKFSAKFLLPQIRDFLFSRNGIITEDTTLWVHDQNVTFEVNFKNTEAITGLFLKDLLISNGGRVNGYFDSHQKELEIEGQLGYISYNGLWMDNLVYQVRSTIEGTDYKINAGELFFNKRSLEDISNNLGIQNLRIIAGIDGDSLSSSISWDDLDTADLNKGHINGFVRFPRQGRIEATVTEAGATVNGENWRIEPENYLVFDTNYIGFNNLVFSGMNESFFIDGKLSQKSEDTLRVRFNNWSLDNFSPLFSYYSLALKGQIEGNVGFTYQEDAPVIFSDLVIDSLDLNNTLLGNTRIRSNWIDDNKSFLINLQILPPQTEEKYKVVSVNGFIYPLDTLRNFDLDIQAQNLQLAVLAPFLKSFSSGLRGLASGQISMEGTFREPALNGKLKLQRTEMKIDFLNVTYSLSNELTITPDAISFKDIVIYDQETNMATCSGTLRHNYFRDMNIDLTIMPEQMLVMNLGRYDNELFFGKAYASGDVRIYGPFNDISLDLDVITQKGTSVYIPINYSVDVSQSDFILFTDAEDSTSIREDYKVTVEGLKLNMAIGVRPDADLQIYLPSNMGSIKAKGQGDLRLGVDARGYLAITGEYVISSGLFTFTLEQLVSKRFEIAQGSSIKWDGDINSADVNITANFRTKTSLDGLGISMLDPESSSKKVNVTVRINMSENLFNPILKFSILFPNLDDQTKQTIYAVLDTTDMSGMNQQAISLLVLNSFTYAGNSGSNPINSAAILANSLSNILSSVSNKFDIGINYIPGDNTTGEELGVALSTQLFDDRLLIDGNFGVTSDYNTQKTSSIVGDVLIEYKLTPDGRFRVKAFNRTNDISIIQNDVPYTQGIGLFYRKDFDNLKDLFTSRKNKKKDLEKEK